MNCKVCGAEMDGHPLRCTCCSSYFPGATFKLPHMTISTIVFIVEWIALIAVLFIFFIIRTDLRHQSMLDNYAMARINQDWDYIYNQLELSNSGLLSKEFFFATRTENDLQQFDYYEPVSYSSEYNSLYGRYVFHTDGDPIPTYIDVRISKDDGLYVPIVETTNGVDFVVPKNSTLKLNGVDLSTVEGVEITDFNDSYIYMLPELFCGDYILEISIPGKGTFTEQVAFTSKMFSNNTDWFPTSITIDTLAKRSRNAVEYIFSSLVNGESYEVLIIRNKELFSETENIKSLYNDLRSQFGSAVQTYDSVTISDIECTMVHYGSHFQTNIPYIEMDLVGTISFDNLSDSDDNSFHASIVFKFKDAHWILDSINFN